MANLTQLESARAGLESWLNSEFQGDKGYWGDEVRVGFREGLGYHLAILTALWSEAGTAEEQEWPRQFGGWPVVLDRESGPIRESQKAENYQKKWGDHRAHLDRDGTNGLCISCGKPSFQGLLWAMHQEESFVLGATEENCYRSEDEALLMDPAIRGRWFSDIEEVWHYCRWVLGLEEVQRLILPEWRNELKVDVQGLAEGVQVAGRLGLRSGCKRQTMALAPTGLNEWVVLHELTHLICDFISPESWGVQISGGNRSAVAGITHGHSKGFLVTEMEVMGAVLGRDAALQLATAAINRRFLNGGEEPPRFRPADVDLERHQEVVGFWNSQARKQPWWLGWLTQEKALGLVGSWLSGCGDEASLMACVEEAVLLHGYGATDEAFLQFGLLAVAQGRGISAGGQKKLAQSLIPRGLRMGALVGQGEEWRQGLLGEAKMLARNGQEVTWGSLTGSGTKSIEYGQWGQIEALGVQVLGETALSFRADLEMARVDPGKNQEIGPK